MRDLLDQIERSLDAELFYLSLLACTAVPDIAAALEAGDGLANGKRYAAWFDHWIRPRFGDIEYPYIKGVMEWFF